MEVQPKTQFDIPEVSQVYCTHKNYEVIDLNTQSNLCIIYFSSNGLYFPNTSQAFTEIILKNNRYEWKKNILKSAQKVIFVRDIKKQWYFEGINAEFDSIEKLSKLLKLESQGLNVICVGNSAGGYAASLVGSLIGASHVFSFSGQFTLLHQLNGELKKAMNPSLVKFEKNEDYKKYYLLTNLIKGSKIKIFYFYPNKSDKDIMQSKLVRSLPNIYVFAFDSDIHSETCYKVNFVDLFNMNLEALIKLNCLFKDKTINPYDFSVEVSGYIKTFKYLLKGWLKQKVKFLNNFMLNFNTIFKLQL